jgi:hypothetical protein
MDLACVGAQLWPSYDVEEVGPRSLFPRLDQLWPSYEAEEVGPRPLFRRLGQDKSREDEEIIGSASVMGSRALM